MARTEESSQSALRQLSATHTTPIAIQRNVGTVSWKMNTATRSCSVGPRYCRKPIVPRVRPLAAEANMMSGIIVNAPAPTRSAR